MKKQISVTIDEEVLLELKNHCKTNSVNRSALVQNLLEDYLASRFIINEEVPLVLE